MNPYFLKILMTTILLSGWTAFLPAWASERVRLDEQSIVIDKKYLRPLVEKLESQKWLIRERARLRLELKLTTQFADSLRAELEARKNLLAELRNLLSITRRSLINANSRADVLELNAKDYREMRLESEKIDRAKNRQLKTLRRRLAGQKIALWTVSAVGGALIFLILI